MISIFDGNIYYTSNDSDKALSAISKKRDEHDPAYTWIGETDFIPYSDYYLYTLIPDEVNDEFGGIFPQGKLTNTCKCSSGMFNFTSCFWWFSLGETIKNEQIVKLNF